MEDHHHLFQPLIPTCTTTTRSTTTIPTTSTSTFFSHNNSTNKITNFISSNLSIIFRLVFIILVSLISLWANHEASKGFDITIVNDSGNSQARKRFSLLYESNDEATRTIFRASKLVEKILYSNQAHPKKQINHVILQLAGQNLSHSVMVHSGEKFHEFILNLCPSIIEVTNFREAMSLAVLRGMSHIWLWGGPPEIVNGMVEYMVNSSTGGSPESDLCWKSGDQNINMAEFVGYCERHSVGFIGRLNRGMKNGWHHRTVDEALGIPAQHLCGSYSFSDFFSLSNSKITQF